MSKTPEGSRRKGGRLQPLTAEQRRKREEKRARRRDRREQVLDALPAGESRTVDK